MLILISKGYRKESYSDDKPLKENNTSTEVDVLHKIDPGLAKPSFFDDKSNELSEKVDEKKHTEEVHCNC